MVQTIDLDVTSDKRVNSKHSCKNCINSPICKFSESYAHFTESLSALQDMPEIMQVDVSCKYFSSTSVIKSTRRPAVTVNGRDLAVTKDPITIMHTTSAPQEPGADPII